MKLISKARSSFKAKKFFYWIVILLTGIYVFSVPSFGESTSITRFIVYISMAMLGIFSITYCYIYENLRINKVTMLIPFFTLFAFIGTLFGTKDFRSWLSLVLLTGSFFVFIYSFKAINNKHLAVSVISIGLFIFSLFFIFYYRNEILNFRSYASESFRLGWYFDNPNGVAAYSAVGVATSFYAVLFLKKKIKWLFVFPILTSLLVGFVTGSRSFIIAVGIFIIILFYFKFKKHKVIYLIVLASAIVLFVILLNLPFMATIKQRLIDAIETLFGTSSKADTSTISRTIWIDYGFYIGTRNLIFGTGVNGFAIYSGVGTYSHSNFAEIICDFGLIGFILFYLPFILLIIRAIRKKEVDKPLIFSFLIYYFLIGFSNVFYYKKFYYMILAFVFYLAYIEVETKKEVKIVDTIKTIVFTCDTMRSGGAEKVISTLANQMSKEGITVTIIGVADYKKPYSFYQLDDGVTYDNMRYKNKNRVNGFRRTLLLRKKIREIKPDVVISFLPNANIYTWLSLVGTKIPHIVSERNNPYLDPKEKVIRIFKKLSFIFSTWAIFQTNDAKNYYPEIVQRKSSVIKNPIVLNSSPCDSAVTKDKVVLAVGRLVKQKNYKCLIDAFKIFNECQNNLYVLKIYGDGILKPELVAYCDTIGISKNVTFAGNDTNWHEKEKNDAMFVLSSDYEGMPNSLAEAMALGIPSISTDCPTGGSKELIQDGVNGYLVPVNNSLELSQKMIEIVSNQNCFYENSRKIVDDCSALNITNKWLDAIKVMTKVTYE